MRSAEEIKSRLTMADLTDIFGVKRERLLLSLPFEEAQSTGVLNPEVTATEWAVIYKEDPVKQMVAYLPFALEKAASHRGLSASRSVQHMEALTWLAGSDEDVAALEEIEYAQYGVPKLWWVCVRFGLLNFWTELMTPALERMARGEECRQFCNEGCGN